MDRNVSTETTPGRGAPIWLDVVIVVCLLGGETISGYVLPPSFYALRVSPLFLLGVLLAAVRHWRYRTPTVIARAWSYARAGLAPHIATRLIALALATRLGVLAVGLGASVTYPPTIPGAPQLSRHPLQNLPARWDGFWYLEIARQGYRWRPERRNTQQSVAFFPGYPLVMRTAGDLVTVPARLLRSPNLFGSGDIRVLWGGVLVSLLCFTLATWRMFRIARDDTGHDASAWKACVLLGTYPFALFLSVPYSESLALLALLSLTLAWRAGDVRKGLLWGIVLGLCRSNGWTIALALMADRVLGGSRQWNSRGGWVLVAAAPVCGAAAYSAYLYHLTGRPLEWVSAQGAWGGALQPASFFTRRWHIVQGQGVFAYVASDPVDALTLVAVVSMVMVAVWLATKRQWLFGAVMLAYLTPAVAIDLPASGRMTALLFPAFIVLGSMLRGGPFILVATAFGACQAWLAWRFFLWNTPY